MKKFIITVLSVSVFFIGLGSLVEKTTANFKSDAQALELIKKARIAIGGDANINSVKSLTVSATTENFFEKNNIVENKGGNLEIALELPNRLSKMLRIGNSENNANGNVEVNKKVQVFVMKKDDGDNIVWNTEDGGDAKTGGKKIIIKKDDGTVQEINTGGGQKIIIKKDADAKILTEDIVGDNKIIVDKNVRIAKISDMRQNELLRTTLALLLTTPEGTEVGYLYKGESTIDGFSVNIVEVQSNGSSIKLYLDKSSNLPKMISFMGLDFPKIVSFEKNADNSPKELIMESGDFGGSVEHQIKYSDYRSIGGLLLPFVWTETVGGKQSQNVNVTNYEINPANIADKFGVEKVIIRKNK